LNLKYLKITDIGLRFLGALQRLEMIVFAKPEFTRGGLERLQRQLPDCEIIVQYAPW
jgi:hypothetical protein